MKEYHITVKTIDDNSKLVEHYYKATVDELPDVIEFGDTISEAVSLVADAIETTEDYYAGFSAR